MEFWQDGKIVAELPIDATPAHVGAVVSIVGLTQFSDAINAYQVELVRDVNMSVFG